MPRNCGSDALPGTRGESEGIGGLGGLKAQPDKNAMSSTDKVIFDIKVSHPVRYTRIERIIRIERVN